MFIRAQGELLHLLTGAAPLDPGRECRVPSLVVEIDDIATWPSPLVVDDDMILQ